MIQQRRNLDLSLTAAANGDRTITSLKAESNADLEPIRAVAVVQLLKNPKGLEQVIFHAYSIAQLYLPDGKLVTFDRG